MEEEKKEEKKNIVLEVQGAVTKLDITTLGTEEKKDADK